MELLSHLRSLEEKEIVMLKQIARVEWFDSGDTNSKFYHSRLRWTRAKNDLVGLKINGDWCEDVLIVRSQVKGYFESKFGVNLRIMVNLDRVRFKSIFVVDNDLLCSNITEKEILETVSQCGSSMCSGPDGFDFLFVKNNWEVIGKDIVIIIFSFQSRGLF